jgi:hypothetical protein
MRFEASALVSLLALGAFAAPAADGYGHGGNMGNNAEVVEKLCPGLDTMDHGCLRYTRGFDVTGVITEVDLTFPQVQSACDCIQECLNRPNTCAAWVYKFTTPQSVQSGHRTCTLYSQFNLPTDVTVEVAVSASTNVQLLQPGNNPQTGSTVPQAFKDINLNTIPDNDAFSGPVWQLATGVAQC